MIYQGANPLVPYDVYLQAVAAGYAGTEAEFYQKLINYELPVGKEIGDVLKVNSSGQIEWGELVALPKGGSTGQYLKKKSAADGDAEWASLNNATTTAAGLMSAADKVKLNSIEASATNATTHIADKANPHEVTKTQVGLGNVANLDQSKAIKSITRNGTTFTYTTLDGDTGTFNQQDNNTTYTLTQDSTDGHKITLTPSSGTATTITIPDNNTTYTAGAGLVLSGTTFKANLTDETSLGTIGSTSKLYAVGVDANGQLAVNVPWTDNNTTSFTITAAASDDDVVNLTGTNGTNKVTYSASHAKKGPASGYTSGNTTTFIAGSGGSGVIKVPQITVDAYGHVTAATDEEVTITMPTISYPVTKVAGMTGNVTLKNLTIGGKTYNGSTAQTITLGDLGLSSALRFVGTTTTAITSGATTAPTIGSAAHTPAEGDVVINSNNHREYVFAGGAWELLGLDSGYKIVQASSVDSGTVAANKWISRIQQDTNGNITATTGTLDTSGTWSGTATNADKLDGKHLNEIAATKSTTLSWDTDTTIATIGGNNINIKLPANPNTNTAHTTFAWTGGTTAGPTGSLSGNHAAVSFPAIPSASASASGIITTGAQTLAGIKTFSSNIKTNGNLILNNGTETDRFIVFDYNDDATAGASWRIASLNSGSGDTNYFAIQTGGSDTGATAWNNAIRLGMNTLDAAFGGNVYPLTNNAKTLGTSSLKWSNVYATTFTGNLSGNATSATTASKVANSLTISLGGTAKKTYDGSSAITANFTTTSVVTGVAVNGTTTAVTGISTSTTTAVNASVSGEVLVISAVSPLASASASGTATVMTGVKASGTTAAMTGIS